MHGIKVEPSARKEIFQQQTLCRGIRMQREISPLNTDFEIPFELFNTPGTEIAPRSNEVGKYFQRDWYRHHTFSIPVSLIKLFFELIELLLKIIDGRAQRLDGLFEFGNAVGAVETIGGAS